MGEIERKKIKSRKSWLKQRINGIGASEVASIVGMNPHQTATELWELKTGIRKEKDLSDNPFVQRGVLWEPVLREGFIKTHPEYRLEYHPFDMLSNSDAPYLFATLDGELYGEDGSLTVLEIKTVSVNNRETYRKWMSGSVADNYYLQVLQQMYCSGAEHEILLAALFMGDNSTVVLRTYEFERGACEGDIRYLTEKAKEFWHSVVTRTPPPLTLTF